MIPPHVCKVLHNLYGTAVMFLHMCMGSPTCEVAPIPYMEQVSYGPPLVCMIPSHVLYEFMVPPYLL